MKRTPNAAPGREAATVPDDMRLLLERHRCPLPFHQARTFLLAATTARGKGAWNRTAIAELWGGKLPRGAGASRRGRRGLAETLIEGMVKPLARHGELGLLFRLVPLRVLPNRKSIAAAASVRQQEVGGFIDCMVGPDDDSELPPGTLRSIATLKSLWMLLVTIAETVADRRFEPTREELQTIARQLPELTHVAETEINVVLELAARDRSPGKRPLGSRVVSRMRRRLARALSDGLS